MVVIDFDFRERLEVIGHQHYRDVDVRKTVDLRREIGFSMRILVEKFNAG